MSDKDAEPVEDIIEEALPEEEATEAPTAPERDLEAECAAMKDQWVRAVAETENLRRRSEKQIEEAAKFAITNFARDLISVQENLYRAIATVPESALQENAVLKNVVDGVEMTKRELDAIFQRHGITRIDPAIGSAFDHNLHQAVAHIPDENNPPGTISNVMQAGYSLKDRLLRPAMVAVAKEVE
jgi:molecular chaperone GrpE